MATTNDNSFSMRTGLSQNSLLTTNSPARTGHTNISQLVSSLSVKAEGTTYTISQPSVLAERDLRPIPIIQPPPEAKLTAVFSPKNVVQEYFQKRGQVMTDHVRVDVIQNVTGVRTDIPLFDATMHWNGMKIVAKGYSRSIMAEQAAYYVLAQQLNLLEKYVSVAKPALIPTTGRVETLDEKKKPTTESLSLRFEIEDLTAENKKLKEETSKMQIEIDDLTSSLRNKAVTMNNMQREIRELLKKVDVLEHNEKDYKELVTQNEYLKHENTMLQEVHKNQDRMRTDIYSHLSSIMNCMIPDTYDITYTEPQVNSGEPEKTQITFAHKSNLGEAQVILTIPLKKKYCIAWGYDFLRTWQLSGSQGLIHRVNEVIFPLFEDVNGQTRESFSLYLKETNNTTTHAINGNPTEEIMIKDRFLCSNFGVRSVSSISLERLAVTGQYQGEAFVTLTLEGGPQFVDTASVVCSVGPEPMLVSGEYSKAPYHNYTDPNPYGSAKYFLHSGSNPSQMVFQHVFTNNYNNVDAIISREAIVKAAKVNLLTQDDATTYLNFNFVSTAPENFALLVYCDVCLRLWLVEKNPGPIDLGKESAVCMMYAPWCKAMTFPDFVDRVYNGGKLTEIENADTIFYSVQSEIGGLFSPLLALDDSSLIEDVVPEQEKTPEETKAAFSPKRRRGVIKGEMKASPKHPKEEPKPQVTTAATTSPEELTMTNPDKLKIVVFRVVMKLTNLWDNGRWDEMLYRFTRCTSQNWRLTLLQSSDLRAEIKDFLANNNSGTVTRHYLTNTFTVGKEYVEYYTNVLKILSSGNDSYDEYLSAIQNANMHALNGNIIETLTDISEINSLPSLHAMEDMSATGPSVDYQNLPFRRHADVNHAFDVFDQLDRLQVIAANILPGGQNPALTAFLEQQRRGENRETINGADARIPSQVRSQIALVTNSPSINAQTMTLAKQGEKISESNYASQVNQSKEDIMTINGLHLMDENIIMKSPVGTVSYDSMVLKALLYMYQKVTFDNALDISAVPKTNPVLTQNATAAVAHSGYDPVIHPRLPFNEQPRVGGLVANPEIPYVGPDDWIVSFHLTTTTLNLVPRSTVLAFPGWLANCGLEMDKCYAMYIALFAQYPADKTYLSYPCVRGGGAVQNILYESFSNSVHIPGIKRIALLIPSSGGFRTVAQQNEANARALTRPATGPFPCVGLPANVFLNVNALAAASQYNMLHYLLTWLPDCTSSDWKVFLQTIDENIGIGDTTENMFWAMSYLIGRFPIGNFLPSGTVNLPFDGIENRGTHDTFFATGIGSLALAANYPIPAPPGFAHLRIGDSEPAAINQIMLGIKTAKQGLIPKDLLDEKYLQASQTMASDMLALSYAVYYIAMGIKSNDIQNALNTNTSRGQIPLARAIFANSKNTASPAAKALIPFFTFMFSQVPACWNIPGFRSLYEMVAEGTYFSWYAIDGMAQIGRDFFFHPMDYQWWLATCDKLPKALMPFIPVNKGTGTVGLKVNGTPITKLSDARPCSYFSPRIGTSSHMPQQGVARMSDEEYWNCRVIYHSIEPFDGTTAIFSGNNTAGLNGDLYLYVQQFTNDVRFAVARTFGFATPHPYPVSPSGGDDNTYIYPVRPAPARNAVASIMLGQGPAPSTTITIGRTIYGLQDVSPTYVDPTLQKYGPRASSRVTALSTQPTPGVTATLTTPPTPQTLALPTSMNPGSDFVNT